MDSKIKIGLILASVRENRRGEGFARWMQSLLAERSDVEPTWIDLKEWALPNYSNAETPGLAEKKYADGTLNKRWFDQISSLDSFVVVTCEYSHGYPGSLKNAIDHIYTPWNYKSVGFVSYGGVAGGSRSVEQLRHVCIELRMVPIRDEVNMSLINLALDEKGWPKDEVYTTRARFMLNELVWMTKVLKAGLSELPKKIV